MKLDKSSIKRTVSRRRFLHQIPELDFDLPETKAYLLKVLDTLDVDKITEVANGIVVELLGNNPGPCLVYRADMDANEVVEETNLNFASTNHGRMHSCGHDGHMAIALGLIEYFSTNKQFPGRLRFVFQPAEENKGGAKYMVDAGILDGVDLAFASHIWPTLEYGKFAISDGVQMSAADAFVLEITGKGGHSGMPELAINPIDVMYKIMGEFHLLKKENVKLVVTQIHVGNPTNVIPNDGILNFTLRTQDNLIRVQMIDSIKEVISSVCDKMSATFHLLETRSYPATVNNFEVVQTIKTLVPNGDTLFPSMASEDFSYFLNTVPGAFVWIGSNKGDAYSLHHPKFDFDEELLVIAIEAWTDILLHFLEKKPINIS